jgi:hypothetical protein
MYQRWNGRQSSVLKESVDLRRGRELGREVLSTATAFCEKCCEVCVAGRVACLGFAGVLLSFSLRVAISFVIHSRVRARR